MREGTLWMHEVFNSDLFMFFVSNGQKVTFVHQNIIQPCVLKNSWNHYILGTLPPFLSSSNYLKNASKLLLFGLRKKKLLSFFVCRSFIVEEKTRLFALAKWLERNNCKSSIIDPNIVTRLDFCERSKLHFRYDSESGLQNVNRVTVVWVQCGNLTKITL